MKPNKGAGWIYPMVFAAILVSTNIAGAVNIYPDSIRARQQYALADSLFDAGEYDRAYPLFEAVARYYEAAADPGRQVLALNRVVLILYIKSKYKEALALGKKNLGLARKYLASDDLALADCLENLGRIYGKKGDWQNRLSHYEQTLDIRCKKLGEEHNLVAASYNNIGLCYGKLGRYDEQLDYYQKALAIRLAIFDEENIEIADVYHNLGSYYRRIGNYQKQLTYNLKSIEIRLKFQPADHIDMAISYNNLATCYGRLGQYDLQRSYLLKSLSIYQKKFGEQHYAVAQSYANIAYHYGSKADYAANIEYQERSLKIFRELVGEEHQKIAKGLGNLAFAYGLAGDHHKEVELAQKALDIAKRVFSRNHISIARAYTSLGFAYYNLKEYDQALRNFKQTRNILQVDFDKHPDLADAYQLMAKSHAALANWDTSLTYFQLALQALLPKFRSANIEDNPSFDNENEIWVGASKILLTVLLSKALVFEKRYWHQSEDPTDLTLALGTFETTVDFLDNYRAQIQSAKARQEMMAKVSSVFEGGIRVAGQLYRITSQPAYLDQIFRFMEKGRSRDLLQMLQSSAAKNFAGIPDSLAQSELEIRSQQAFYRQQMVKEHQQKDQPDSARIRRWQDKLFELDRQYERLIRKYTTHYPEYYHLMHHSTFTTIPEVRKEVLGKTKALLEFFWGDSALHIFALTGNRQQYLSLPMTTSLTENCRGFRALLSDQQLKIEPERSYRQFTRLGYSLYRDLFQPLEDILQDSALAIDRLIIVPDGLIGYLPLDIVLTAPAGSDRIMYPGLSYLFRQYTLQYAYAASLLKDPYTGINGNGEFLAYAPGFDPIALSGSISDERRSMLGALQPLQFAQQEVENLSNHFPGEIFTGDRALEHDFKGRADRYSILHLATHTLIDDEHPMNSTLVFAPSTDTLDDGLLQTYEIFNLNLSADLVVLSACNSGFGKWIRGEGIMSLGRGFAYAGCPGLVMSLWPANDRSTATIMDYFYQELAQGRDIHQAIRQSKLQFLETSARSKSHPYYWAAFISYGASVTVPGRKLPFSLHGGLAALLVIILGAGISFFTKRKRYRPEG